jgi:hypothetical protein
MTRRYEMDTSEAVPNVALQSPELTREEAVAILQHILCCPEKLCSEAAQKLRRMSDRAGASKPVPDTSDAATVGQSDDENHQGARFTPAGREHCEAIMKELATPAEPGQQEISDK